jgi:hypothetical protein
VAKQLFYQLRGAKQASRYRTKLRESLKAAGISSFRGVNDINALNPPLEAPSTWRKQGQEVRENDVDNDGDCND